MSLYEQVIIIKSSISSSEVDKIVAFLEELVGNYNGKSLKKEYWGIRDLAYEINKNKKAHYMLFCFESNSSDLLKEIDRKMKLNQNVLRFKIIKVEEIEENPSKILASTDKSSKIVDVSFNAKNKEDDSAKAESKTENN